MRSRTAFAAAGLLVLGALGTWLALGRRPPAPAAAPAIPVVVAPAEARDIPVWLTSVGAVQSPNIVTVRARVQGELVSVGFAEGEEVRAGQVLARIDARPFEALVRQAEANLRRDEAQLAHARSELQRYVGLAEKGFVSEANVEALRAQAAGLEATVQGDRAQLETAQLNAGFTTITSPIAGRAGLRQANPGAMIRDSDANGLVTITQVRPIAVVFSIPQDDLQEVRARARQGALPVAVQSREGGVELARGELTVVDNQVDSATGQVKLKAVVANETGALWPGQLVATRLLLRTEHAAAAVPDRALLSGRDGPYVYVVRHDSTVEARVVATGASADGFTAILRGLQAGESVVTEGQSRLSAGMRVEARAR